MEMCEQGTKQHEFTQKGDLDSFNLQTFRRGQAASFNRPFSLRKNIMTKC